MLKLLGLNSGSKSLVLWIVVLRRSGAGGFNTVVLHSVSSFPLVAILIWEVLLVQCVLKLTGWDIKQINWLVLLLRLSLSSLLIVSLRKVWRHPRCFEVTRYSIHWLLAHSCCLLPVSIWSSYIHNSLNRCIIKVSSSKDFGCVI